MAMTAIPVSSFAAAHTKKQVLFPSVKTQSAVSGWKCVFYHENNLWLRYRPLTLYRA